MSSKVTAADPPTPSEFKNCECCTCDYAEEDICIVEGSTADKSLSLRTQEMTKTVWGKVKPPPNLGNYQPAVSARKTDIIRGQLNRNFNGQDDYSNSNVTCCCKAKASKST